MEWICTKERLPEVDDVEVIVSIKGCKSATTLCYIKGEFFDEGGNVYNVTHWQPLPKCPNI